MDVFECIRTRRTVRNFKPDPIPQEIVHKILQAARWSPSSSNAQPWHFVAIQNRETIKQLGEIATQGPFIADAPLIIVVVMDDQSWGCVAIPQEDEYGAQFEMDLPERDWAGVCRSLGGFGVRAETADELAQAMHAALSSGKPAVVHVPIQMVLSPFMVG